jgi:hypothetical protein
MGNFMCSLEVVDCHTCIMLSQVTVPCVTEVSVSRAWRYCGQGNGEMGGGREMLGVSLDSAYFHYCVIFFLFKGSSGGSGEN